MNTNSERIDLGPYLLAWSVHIFTALGSLASLFALIMISKQQFDSALWFMGAAILIDAVDGSFARLLRVKQILPFFDGALLDNLVDFLSYVIVPAFFLYSKPGMLPESYAIWLVATICLCSCYQFCQADAKTSDHFFKGFPCHWNTAVFVLFILNTSMQLNAWLLTICCILIFVPIKYLYPSRLDNVTKSFRIKVFLHVYSGIYALSYCMLLWYYPQISTFWLYLALSYIAVYLFLSLFRTFRPLTQITQ